MSTQTNKDFIRKYFEAISGHSKTPELMNQFIDEQPLKDHIAAAEQAFPAYTMDIDKLIAEDDLVAVIGRVGGTHTGPFMGIPATGKSFSDVPFHITYRVKDGKIVDHWLLMDSADLMQKLGLVATAA